MVRTKHPIVLIHGVFGYGTTRPLWNRWAPYWPQRALDAMAANYLVVDVGVLSSDHDRACEAFYQLYGGRVDYGENHAAQHGHARFGYTHAAALHPNWNARHPVHLLGHSFGATTAIELYQLICSDFFGVGSDHTWVTSIVSVAGPLSGTTLTHLFGLHDGKMVAYTLGHLVGASLCLWQTLLVRVPALRGFFDYRMPQWEIVTSHRQALSAACPILASYDLAVYDILPARRLERNSRLTHMDKPFLVSIATSTHTKVPVLEVSLGVLLVGLLAVCAGSAGGGCNVAAAASAALAVAVAAWLFARLRDLDYATLPCFSFLRVQLKWCVRFLHEIFDGFDRDEWEHNDGAVNVVSMTRPMQLRRSDAGDDELCDAEDTASDSGSDAGSTASTAASISSATASSQPLLTTHPLHLDAYGDAHHSLSPTKPKTLRPGRWYVHQLQKNHLAGTHFDRDSPALFQRLLRMIATEMED